MFQDMETNKASREKFRDHLSGSGYSGGKMLQAGDWPAGLTSLVGLRCSGLQRPRADNNHVAVRAQPQADCPARAGTVHRALQDLLLG